MEKSDKSLERVPSYGKPKGKRLSIRSMKGRRYSARDRDEQLPKSAIPRNVHRTLWGLFAEIEREFERVCTENSERNVFILCCIIMLGLIMLFKLEY